jgi:hypothetical protein
MKFAIKGSALALALTLALVGSAFAASGEPILGHAEDVQATPLGLGKAQLPRTSVTAIVYDNTASAPNFGVSSTDLASTWGDRVTTTGVGILNLHKFTVFNTGTSAGPLLTALVRIDFFDAVTSAGLGAYQTNVTFGAGLNPGFFSIVTVSNLDPLAINLNVQDIIITQRVLASTGTANRLGIASLDPPTVGSSPTSMYISSATIGGGVPGFYTFQNGPANPGYQVVVTVPTVGVAPTTWGTMKALYN